MVVPEWKRAFDWFERQRAISVCTLLIDLWNFDRGLDSQFVSRDSHCILHIVRHVHLFTWFLCLLRISWRSGVAPASSSWLPSCHCRWWRLNHWMAPDWSSLLSTYLFFSPILTFYAFFSLFTRISFVSYLNFKISRFLSNFNKCSLIIYSAGFQFVNCGCIILLLLSESTSFVY